MAPDGASSIVLSGDGSTSNRLAATVAGQGSDQSAYRQGFKAYSRLLDEHIESGSKPQYVLVEDVTPEQFESFVAEGKKIVGEENFFVNNTGKPEPDGHSDYLSLPHFEDFFKIDEPERFMASAHIQPASVEEVASIVKLANKYKQPLHAVSMGRNLGYGGSAVRLRGTAILDLKRMNKVLQIDEESAFCLLEPGVSYFDLYEELQRRNSQLWVDCPDIGWGSVVGNMAERGAGYTPYGDHFMFHCGMEVVLPNGDIVRTGNGAMEGSDTWQTFPYGFGPYHDGIFTQSSLGIITKAGFWLLPNPGGFKPFLITVPRKEDLHELVERIRPLRNRMIIQNAPTIRHVLLDAACLRQRKDWEGGQLSEGALPDEKVYEIAEQLDLGYWGFYGALYGPLPMQDMLWSVIWGSLSQIKGSKHYFEDDVGPSSLLHSRAKTLAGIPNLLELDWISWLDNGAHCFFSPISNVTGDAAVGQWQLLEEKCRQYGFDPICTQVIGLRELHNICCIVYDRHSKEQRDRMRTLMQDLIQAAADKGWSEYRTHLAFQDQVAGTFNFNGGAISRLNETLKDALDPNGILSPGKNGVWGQRFSHLRNKA